MIQHKLFERAIFWDTSDLAIQWDSSSSCQWIQKSLEAEKAHNGKHIGVDTVDRPLAITNGYILHAVRQIARRFKALGVPFDPDKTTLNSDGMVKVNLEVDEEHPSISEINQLSLACDELSLMNQTMIIQSEQALSCIDRHAFDFGSTTDLPRLDEVTIGSVTLPYDRVYIELVNPHGNVICCSAEYINRDTPSWNKIRELGLRADHEFGSTPILMMFWVHFPSKNISTFYREFGVIGWKKDGSGPETMIVSPSKQDIEPHQKIEQFSSLGRNVINMSTYIMHCLEVLNANGVETVEVPAPAKLNKKREKNGKPPLVAFHTLKLYKVKDRKVTGQREPDGTPGSQKKGHWRRAHLRTYKNDRYVNAKGQTRLIKQRWIGGGSTSIGPDKDYKIL
ncbi:MAG: hypothetical protein GY938_13195 [Ketobacter sp.]|nr:hypothetical protein [Ketobacter sp.]